MAIAANDLTLEVLRTNKAEKALIDYCNRAFAICRTGMIPFERQWYLNLAFYFGRHYAEWATTSLDASGIYSEAAYTKLYQPAVPKWRVRLIINKIRSIIRGELAKVTKEKPRGFIIPTSTDDDDLAGARAGEAIHEFLWRELMMNRCIRRAVFWELLCGTSFVKDWYDQNKVDAAKIKGAIQAEPVSPFHLCVPDLQEEELDNQPFVIHTMAKDPDWIYKNYKIQVQPNASAGIGILEQRFLAALGVSAGASQFRYTAVKEAWIKPNSKFPDGQWVLWTGDQLLSTRAGFLYDHKEFPFTKFDHIPTGRFYGESSIVDLIPLQKEYNRTRSQIIEAKNRTSKPQFFAYRGSVDPNKVTSEPGLIIFVAPGYQYPQPMQPVNLPSYVIEELDRTQTDMMDISSQHEISKGAVPPGVTAATAISFLQEQDDSKLSTTISSLEEGVERIGRHFLYHVQQFWTAQRQIRVLGENRQAEAFLLSNKDLRGNVDFKVESGSAAPVSRAAKQAFIMEMMKLGFIPPDRGLRYLDMAEVGRLYEEMQLAARQAQRENMKMMAGFEIKPNSWDNDDLHIYEHNNKRMSEAFESSKDEIKIRFEDHVELHKVRRAQKLGITMAPGDPRLDSVGMMQQGPMPNGSQPQLPPANPQGSPNAAPV